MADLYKGIEGSPITYLAADISAGQTTISIADDTALPEAPNIATIGFGENIETVKYGQKSNGVLQEVVRGVEGIPRAWQAGTEVARFFTAYDHLAMIDKITENANNLATHQAEIMNRWIEESGSNDAGHYVKFGDGTMICHKYIGTHIVDVGANTFEFLDFVIPKPFIGDYSPSCGGRPTTSGGNPRNAMLFANSLDESTVRITLKTVEATHEIRGLSWHAIGRWK